MGAMIAGLAATSVPAQILEIEQLVASSVQLLSQAWAAYAARDQVSLDAVHARAVLMSNTMKPAGEADIPVSDVPGS